MINWGIAAKSYDPSLRSIRFAGSVTAPTEIAHWDGDAPAPTLPQLETAWQTYLASNPGPPDWESFCDWFAGSQYDQAIAATSDQRSLIRLEIEFGKRSSGTLEPARLAEYWNGAIASVSLSETAIAEINSKAESFRLPVRLDAAGGMVPAK